ncbi:AAA ATPase domain-containing protein [Parafrankia irregularis]|uniref:AAA ATPase domain-containing protein n=1 Tax=Parafrankia irregularis TaxID=795642 RepID=A0A0S4QYZ8_9ACTN|nr:MULTISPECIES: aminoglycoside phosphotransferase family protein [Parafrankia]MBE3206416.1 phosphotransferase [Parafrankia sp. CH37]CUU60383.1 AAA ATPase domain-containing protein [Parafrankia irregularis]
MAPTPRFHRVAALQRRFVDREPVLAAFTAELARIGEGPRIFNPTGVGGIGKSRLLRELKDRAAGDYRTASLDLQVHSLRQQEDALAVLRGELGRQRVHFDRFDIAYAVLWQRLHPHLRLSRSDLAFVDDSSILTDIVDTVAGLPVFGTARGLLKILDKGSADMRRRMRVRRDTTLAVLDELPNSELADAVTFLFAEDLRASSADKPYVIIIDSHEALVPNPVRSGRGQLADIWLRDLVAQFDRGLVVIASREPLHWELTEPGWEDHITACGIDDLPMEARLELLNAGGITDPVQRQTIATASAGLPFYLNLAVDTHLQTGGRISGDPVSQQEILARFLQHVEPNEIRALEILSPARIFDYDIFQTLAASFNLPGHRIAWESVSAYSFVYPAADALRFHQLMATALRERLSPATATDIHTLLRRRWEERADSVSGQDSGIHAARALREAAYHALSSGQATGEALLSYTDRAVLRGGHSAAHGIIEDLRTNLPGRPDRNGLVDALRCLQADAAVRIGDAAAVTALIPEPVTTLDLDTTIGARLVVAAGHGRRIAGDTREALDTYTGVWNRATAAPKLTAGLWAADLHMAQGRFRDAEALAAELSTSAPAQDAEFLGDIARLRCLAHRFAFDFDTAARYLDEATTHYTAAGSVLGLANIQTNRAELLAHTDPPAAVIEAGRAIEVQREIGARHEIGKAYTALAIAQLHSGNLDAAETALHSACEALEAANYRSGRARAEFYRAIIQIRRGRLDEAHASLRWTIRELEAADVYPTIVLCAARALELIGVEDEQITYSRERATLEIQPMDPLDRLDEQVTHFVAALTDGREWNPNDYYLQATGRSDAAAGFYNHNVRMTTPTGDVIVRIPIAGSDIMDLKIWPESQVLRAIRGTVTHAPRLLFTDARSEYQILDCLPGRVLDETAPRGTAVPAHVIGDVVEMFTQLGNVPPSAAPAPPSDWPADGDTTGFARRLSAVTEDVHSRFLPEFGDLYSAFGIPTNALAEIENRWQTLRPRPFRLLHTDIHRKNIIISDGRSSFLDWELALWGDPVYDLAVHIHKMAYQDNEHDALLDEWTAVVTGPHSEGWQPDLDTYLSHERVKSAIVDTVRYTKILTESRPSRDESIALTEKLAGKISAAHSVLGNELQIDGPTIATLIEQWRGRR